MDFLKWVFYNGKYKVKLILHGILLEDFKKVYGNLYGENISNKNVLDIGGYCGETALYFKFDENAKNVYVYEPVKEHFSKIQDNIKINALEGKVFAYNIGVSEIDGTKIIKTSGEHGTGRFGLPGNKYSVKINTETWNTILERHKKDNIYLAKVDCEGGEKYLLETDKELIKKIPHWVMETHSQEIEKNMLELFEELKYKKELRQISDSETKVWYFHL